MFDARASPAVGYPACSPHRATCRRFSGAPARSHPTSFDTFAPFLTQQYETPLADAPASCSEEAGLRTVVCGLEAKVMALQEQLAHLTLELLRERSERYERRLSSLEALSHRAHP